MALSKHTTARVAVLTPVALVGVLVAAVLGRVIGEATHQARLVDDLTGPEEDQ